MTSTWGRVRALAGKEWAELVAAPGVLVGPLVMLVTAVVMPLVVAIGVPAWTGERLSDAEDLVALARESLPATLALDAGAAVEALLLSQFLPLLVLVPVVGAMALVTTSVVDELQRRSLEPLLATPLTTAELILAKAGSAFVVAMALLACGAAAYGTAAVVLARPGVVATLLSMRTTALLAGLAPAAAAATLLLGVVVSSRAKDARSAQQFAVLIVLPLLGLFVAGLESGGVGAAALLWWSAGLWAAAAAFAWLGVRVFDRERILTRWTQ
jgi:ABC-2 type transport system permease protein